MLTIGSRTSALRGGALAARHPAGRPRAALSLHALLRGQDVLQVEHLFAEHTAAHVEQLRYEWIAQPLIHGAIAAPAVHDAAGAEDPELLGGGRGLYIEFAEEVTDADLAAAQELEDVDAQGVAKSLEELGFEPVQRLGHVCGASIAALPSLRVSESIKTGTIPSRARALVSAQDGPR
jgi:hypothetical protein